MRESGDPRAPCEFSSLGESPGRSQQDCFCLYQATCSTPLSCRGPTLRGPYLPREESIFKNSTQALPFLVCYERAPTSEPPPWVWKLCKWGWLLRPETPFIFLGKSKNSRWPSGQVWTENKILLCIKGRGWEHGKKVRLEKGMLLKPRYHQQAMYCFNKMMGRKLLDGI